jgi:hypothetical protein
MKRSICFILFVGMVAIGCKSSSPTDAGDVTQDDQGTTPDGYVGRDALADTDAAGRDVAQDTPETAETWTDTGVDTVAADVTDDATADTPYGHDETPSDVSSDVTTDTAACNKTWQLLDMPADSVQLADPAPLNVGRTTRLTAFAMVSCNQQRAMPLVTVDQIARTVTLQIRNWDQINFFCLGPDFLDSRIIAFVPTTAGSWHVKTPGGADLLAFEVATAPETGCTPEGAFPCDEDCDCTEGVCLGGSGFVGPFTACARPCEVNADCSGGASCVSADDGLDHYCDPGTPACTDGGDCPSGFSCEGSACVPDFKLAQNTRKPCQCNEDCAEPLRCVEPANPEGTKRCEFTCQTAGAWCPSAHFCGTAFTDVSGLAESDSVCGWIGE